MEIVRDLVMVGETVRLDNRHFIECTFTDCVLEYGGTEFVLERTAFSGCRHAFFDGAFLTLQYLRTIGAMPPGDVAASSEFCHTVQ